MPHKFQPVARPLEKISNIGVAIPFEEYLNHMNHILRITNDCRELICITFC